MTDDGILEIAITHAKFSSNEDTADLELKFKRRDILSFSRALLEKDEDIVASKDAEITELIHDIERYQQIDAELLAENEKLKKAIKRQASAAIAGMNAAKAVSYENLELARKLMAESSPENLTSERAANELLTEENEKLRAEIDRINSILNAPEINNFVNGAALEAAHQRDRWGTASDAGKTPADWFWLIGYLAGKALHAHTAGNLDKALHHTITTAAALCNWHASILNKTNMRPGIETPPES
jgi:hypothetical protein